MSTIQTVGAALVAGMGDAEQLQLNKRASRNDWERFRPLIKRLYVDEDRTLKDVMAILLAEHGHNGSKKMYKSRIQKWKLDKNNKFDDMLFLRHRNEERRAIQKSTKFRVRGQPVDWNDVQRYFKRKKEDEELLASSRYVVPSTPPHIEYRTPSPTLSHPQYASSPRSLTAAQDTAMAEQLFYNINVYLDGSFRSGDLVIDVTGCLTSLKAEASVRRLCGQEFHGYATMAVDLVEKNLFVQARRVLSLASAAVADVVQLGNPTSLHFLFDAIVTLLRRERIEIAVMFQKYIADIASNLVPVGHPWGEIFRLLGTINITELAAVSIQSWKCFVDLYEMNLGRYNQDRVYCYIRYLMQVVDLVDAERLLRRLLADCGRVWGMTAFMTMVVMHNLVCNLYSQEKYVDAEKLALDILIRDEAGLVRGAMKGRALELLANTQYRQGKKALAETNMRSSILNEDSIECTGIRRRIVLESWLQGWSRESDADEVKAEIDQLIREDEIDRDGLGCEP